MNEKQKLIEYILEDLKRDGGDCELCVKMGWKCPVYIPEDAALNFQPDTSVCNIRDNIYKTLTIKHL